jgi:hypothetical protein
LRQNRRWRAAIVDAVAGVDPPPRRVLDVATGTAGVAAVNAVVRADEAYRVGLMNDAATTAREAGGVTPWAPIYRELLAEQRPALPAAAGHCDPAAVSCGIPAADRFDWRALLKGEG